MWLVVLLTKTLISCFEAGIKQRNKKAYTNGIVIFGIDRVQNYMQHYSWGVFEQKETYSKVKQSLLLKWGSSNITTS